MTSDAALEKRRTMLTYVLVMAEILLHSYLSIRWLRFVFSRTSDFVTASSAFFTCAISGFVLIFFTFYFMDTVKSLMPSRRLEHAIRLGKAMQLLKAHTNKEYYLTIQFNNIRVYKSSIPIPLEGAENVLCKEILEFLSQLKWSVNKFFVFGSENYCCDREQIEAIIERNIALWGSAAADTTSADAMVQKILSELEEEKKKYLQCTQEKTAALGRGAKLRKQLDETKQHMAVLVELAHTVTRDVTPPRPLTRDEIKKRYLSLAGEYALDNAPSDYVELFRKAMPREYINWSGAPVQGRPASKT